MQHLPNILTISRTIGSLLLFTTQPLSALFYTIYIFCGISDIADGGIARKFNLQTVLGAKLDSIADAVFVAVSLTLLLPVIDLTTPFLFCIFIIILLRLLSIIAGLQKYREFTPLHTYSNKLTGIFLFCLPFFIRTDLCFAALTITTITAVISATEELMINIISGNPNRNCKSIFHTNRQ
ncbi:MAG: CDP-alcohol phosphatidyltransferase family protein [Bacillota bacterium]|jgi:phosphatidylglycerophosphate synthase